MGRARGRAAARGGVGDARDAGGQGRVSTWRYVPRRTLARWLRLAAVIGLASLCWGVTTASTDANLGPHHARYDVTTDGEVTVDLGPLGTLVIDSPLPVLGVRVTVMEIPREVTAVEKVSTLEALGSDLDRYVQFFTGPRATMEVVVRGLVVDAIARSLLAFALVGGGALVLRATLGDRRRAEVADVLRPHRRTIAGSVAIVLLVGATVTSGVPGRGRSTTAQQASTVFDGTALEGARITGRLAGVIDTYGGYLVDAYRESEAFYDRAMVALGPAWSDRVAADRVLATLRTDTDLPPPQPVGGDGADDEPTEDEPTETLPGEAPADAAAVEATVDPGDTPAGGGGEPAEDAGAPTDVEATPPGPTPSPTRPTVTPAPAPDDTGGVDISGRDLLRRSPDDVDPVVMVVVSDLHCNVGMARVIGELVELAEADVVLNAGDTTVNGTAVESYCVNAFVRALPPDVPMVVADGNHDSALTSAQEAAAGAIVLDGAVVEVEGVRILGDSDPNETRIGVGTHPVGEESRAEAAARLAEVACEDPDGVDLLLVHTPAVGTPALGSGCVPAQVSGHLHRRLGPLVVGSGIRYVSDSTAGAASGQPTVGPLRGTAEMTVLRFDRDSGAVLDHRLVQVHTDASVTVGPVEPWPSPPRRPLVGPAVE